MAVRREFSIAAGEYAASVTARGGGLRTLTHQGRHLVDGFDAGGPAAGSRGQILAPWPNRLEEGRWRYAGRMLHLPLNDTASRSASHGLVRDERWLPASHRPHAVRLRHRLQPRPGYPFLIDLTVDYRVHADTGLAVTLTARNSGTAPAPIALGMHPYLAAQGSGHIDAGRLRLPAGSVAVPRRGPGRGAIRPVLGTRFDFRESRPLAGQVLDDAFTDLDRDAQGRFRAELETASGTVELWAGPTARWVQVYTGDAAPMPWRRTGIAIEPMTAPANALATGQDLVWLAPGREHRLTWGVVCR